MRRSALRASHASTAARSGGRAGPFSREEILESVFDAADTPGTVDTYVHYLRRKTDVDIVTTVRGRGYRLGQL